LGSVQPLTVGIGAGTLAVIILVRKLAPRIPASVVGVAAATIACAVFGFPVETIGTRFGGIPSSLPLPSWPTVSWATIRAVFPDAFTIALLAAIESLLSAVVADGMTGDRHNANMELVAQGVGNIAGAIFGGIPATGAIARTATNIKAGAQSPVAGIVHALTLVLFILFLSPVASAIPLAALSAVLMVVAWDMSDVDRFVRLVRRSPKSDVFVLLTTFTLTVVVDLTFAVQVGVVMATFLFLNRMIEVAEIKPGAGGLATQVVFGSGNQPGGADQKPGLPAHRSDIEVFEITGPFFFGVADIMQDTLTSLEKTPRSFILRLKDVPAIDSTGIAGLESFLRHCQKKKTRLLLSELQEQPRRALERAGFIATLGAENIAGSVEAAIKIAEQ